MESSNQELDELRRKYESDVRSFVDDMYTGIVGFLESSRYADLVDSIGELADDVNDNIKLMLNNSDSIEDDLESMVKDLVHAAFQKMPSESVGMKKETRDIYRWDADVSSLVRMFVGDLGSLGKDTENGTPSIFELAHEFVQNATKLVNQTILEATSGGYTTDTVQDALYNAFQVIRDGEDFDRDVVIREVAAMIAKAAELFKLSNSNIEANIKSAVRWVDERLLDYSDGKIRRIPAKMFVAPLVLADYIFSKASNDSVPA